jgi:hypothetical protein
VLQSWSHTTTSGANAVVLDGHKVAMKRIPLLLPPEMLIWIESKAAGVENRQTIIRRLIAQAMKADQQPKV